MDLKASLFGFLKFTFCSVVTIKRLQTLQRPSDQQEKNTKKTVKIQGPLGK